MIPALLLATVLTAASSQQLLEVAGEPGSPPVSYSPINTPFGYFGTTLDPSSGAPRGFNFSMWTASTGIPAP